VSAWFRRLPIAYSLRAIRHVSPSRLLEQNLKAKRRVLELRVAEHIPVLVEVLLEKLLDVPEGNDGESSGACVRGQRPKGG